MAEDSYSYGYYSGYRHPSRSRHSLMLVPLMFIAGFALLYILASMGVVEFSVNLTVALVAAGMVYMLTLYDIRIGLAIMLLAIGVSPEISYAGFDNLRLQDFIVPAIFLAWVTRIVRKRTDFESTNLKIPIIMMMTVMIVSSIIGIVWRDLDMRRSLTVMFKLFEYYLIFVLVLNTIKSKRELRVFVYFMLICSLLAAFYSVFVYMEAQDFTGQLAQKRLMGPEGETANILGGYFIFHMLLAVGLLFQQGAVKHRTWLWIYVIVMLYPMIHTQSRTSYAAFFAGLLLLGILRNRKIFVFGLILFMLVPLLVNPDIVMRLETIADIFSDNPPPAWEARVVGWQAVFSNLSNSPLIGFGVGKTSFAVDNEYVRVVGDIGLIGLLIFLWMLVKMFQTSYRGSGKLKDQFLKGFALGYLGGLLGLVIHAIAATTFTTIRTMEPFFFATGMLYAACNNFIDEKEDLYEPASPKQITISSDEVFVFAENGLDEYLEDDSEISTEEDSV